MKKTVSAPPVAVLALLVAACGGSQEPAAPAETTATAAPAEPAAAGSSPAAAVASAGQSAPAAFAQCKTCHAVEKGKHMIGPSLAGVMGTRAGEIEGYAFSAPLKASGLTWDDATMDKWLEAPMQLVPGTKMTYAGLKDAAKRKDVIEYLKTLK